MLTQEENPVSVLIKRRDGLIHIRQLAEVQVWQLAEQTIVVVLVHMPFTRL